MQFATVRVNIIPMKRSQHTHKLKLLPFTTAPKSICILRLSALGDVTHVLPMVSAIQATWPQTSITWVIGKLEYQLLKHLNNIEFVIFDKKQSFAAYRKVKAELAGRQFDILLQMQVALRANLLSTAIKSPIRLGWDNKRSRDWHHKFINHQVPEIAYQHQAQGFLSFARSIGLSVREPVWELPISNDAREFANEHLPGEQPTLVISPCSSHTLRNWSVDRYAAVADYAATELDLRVVLSGGPSKLELEVASGIENSMQNDVINLVGKDTLQQSLGILQKADIVISPDSGPAHIANALGTPVIGLYAATWSRRSGPFNSLDLCVDRFPEAARQFLNKEPRDLRWGSKIEQAGVMDLISVEDVIEKLKLWHKPMSESIELPVKA